MTAQTLEEALAAVQRAVTLNDSLTGAHKTLGYVYLWQKQYEQAIAEMEQAVALAPEEAWTYTALAETLIRGGRSDEALRMVEQALRLNPKFSLEVHKERVPIKDPAVLERHIEALRQAGLK